jgi:hypothetical protein
MIPDGATLRSNAVVSINDITFGIDAADGTRWDYDKLTGWWDPPNERSRVEDRPGQDGSFTADPLHARRLITIGGMVRASNRGVAAVFAQRVAAIGRRVTIGVDDPDLGFMQCEATRLDANIDGSALGAGIFRYSLTFEAADPRKYGAQQFMRVGLREAGVGGLTYPLTYPLDYGTAPVGGLASLTNFGTAATEPTFLVSGPLLSGFNITYAQTGRQLTYSASAGLVTLDCSEGSATEGGQDRTRYLTIREWFQVAAGMTASFSFTTLGAETSASVPAPTMTVQMASAYL